METITYLKKGLLYGNLDLKESLTRFKDIGESIECPLLVTWAEMELLGYPDDQNVADYRFYPKVYNVNFKNGTEKFNDFPVPFESLHPENIAGRWSYYSETVNNAFEDYRLEDGELHIPANDLQPTVHTFLTELFGPDIFIIGVCEIVSSKIFRKIILASEEIMLNFLLSLEAQFGPSPNAEMLKLFSVDISALFVGTFVLTGKADHLYLSVKYKPIDLEGCCEALFELFDDCDVPDNEMDEGFDLLDEERESAINPETLGPVLTEYIKKMAYLYPKFGYQGVKLKKAIVGYYGLDKIGS